jgi:hypothetical protein
MGLLLQFTKTVYVSPKILPDTIYNQTRDDISVRKVDQTRVKFGPESFRISRVRTTRQLWDKLA